MSYILGLNAYHADSSACLFYNNELVFATEEERLRRVKHWAGFPSMSIQACLHEAGISMAQIDHVAIGRDASANMIHKIRHVLTQSLFSGTKHLLQKINNRRKIASINTLLAETGNISLDQLKAQIHNVEHHRAHLASAFYASPYSEAALLSVDGFGDFTSTMTGWGHENKIDIFDTVIYPHSLGIFYTAFTQFLGFKNYGDEYKVMGLAPYGKPTYYEALTDVVRLLPDGLFELNNRYFKHNREGVLMAWDNGIPTVDDVFSDYMVQKFGSPRRADEVITQYHSDLAASVQRVCEEAIFHILRHLHKQTHCDTLCLAGGVAQNSVANGKIYQNTPFINVFTPPAATDAGTAIGAALWVYYNQLQKPREIKAIGAATGQRFDNTQIEQLLQQRNIAYKTLADEQIYSIATDCLCNGGVVGWFNGRSELGPRALGHRSILADPRRSDAKDLLNLKIKRREQFRPFAPSVLAEQAHKYFELSHKVPFMEKVFVIRPEKRSEIPAVTHVDGTGRLQTVEREQNPRYYKLIEHFYQTTGVPILLNTSFNENEPIVNTPTEALDCFLRTKMDMLILENCLIERKNLSF